MILAHFGPGVYERLGVQGVVLDVLTLIGRFATPTFIALFGLTLAFAYMPRALKDPASVRHRLVRRSFVVLLAAFAVSVPGFITTLWSETHWGGSIFLDLLLDLYGVLSFYFLAILCAAFLVGSMARSPYAAPALVGAGLVLLGTWLGFDTWKSQGETAVELARLTLVSGKYALLTNLGVALLIASFGWHLSRLREAGNSVVQILIVSGCVMLALGLGLGRIVGWRSIADLGSNYGAPPQLWYMFMVCGVMLLLVALFDARRLPVVSFIMEHTGRNPLAIYVAHVFVLPGTAALRAWAPGLPDVLHAGLPLLVFLAYWAYVVLGSSRASEARRPAVA